MAYKFKITRGNAVLNFSQEYCQSRCELIESDSFLKVLQKFIRSHSRRETTLYMYLHQFNEDDIALSRDLQNTLRMLLVLTDEQLISSGSDYACYLEDKKMFRKFVEGLYTFWRKLQRYAVVFNEGRSEGFQNVHFTTAQANFEELVLKTYRSIEETALGKSNKVYRQITAGVNAGLMVTNFRSNLPYEYRCLDDIPFIEQVIIHPPFIAYSKRNKRDGVFPEINYNPIEDHNFDPDQWFCYPAKIGKLIAFVYFNVKFMAQGVALCNLFELATEEEYQGRKPDLIYVYGYEDGEMNQAFYQDEKNGMLVSLLSANDYFDYFGYMKKMCLTLHNVYQLNHHNLPIHGAMIRLKLHDGTQKNIVVMGDSGAGKSETIEQIKGLGEAYIEDTETIYDDMGLLHLNEEGKITTSGTEVGAFVRLDDLDAGYSFKELDRSVFLNPDQQNARVVIPITDWEDVVAEHHVDMFLYANNYDSDGAPLDFFDNVDDALKVFRAGQRMAKGTTTEYGLVGSYFANPFGPVQRQEQTEPILREYFEKMFEQGIRVGQLHTRLGIKGNEKTGPKDAAYAILRDITGDTELKALSQDDDE